MSICEPECREAAKDEGAFAGLELQHDLYLTLTDWTVWEHVSTRLIALGADLQSLQVSRQGDGFSVRCRLKRLSSEAARGLSGSLLDAGVASQASVEHLMLAKPPGSGAR